MPTNYIEAPVLHKVRVAPSIARLIREVGGKPLHRHPLNVLLGQLSAGNVVPSDRLASLLGTLFSRLWLQGPTRGIGTKRHPGNVQDA
jgi:hypothetical protein